MFHEDTFLSAAIAASVALASPAVKATQEFVTPEMRAIYIAEHDGPDALRHFVERTRMVYALNARDYPASFAPEAAPEPAAEPEGAAPSGEDPQKAADELREQIYRDLQHD